MDLNKFGKKLTYHTSLDGLRAIAVIFVVVYHWFPNPYVKILPFGSIGVDIFFVLSGFLITRILLYEREREQPKLKLLWNFYIKRSLRIFPLYYAAIFGLILFHDFFPNPINRYFAYFMTYTQNFLFIKYESFLGGKVGHLWSLAVEEQFYLVWPWLVFFLEKKFLKYFFLITIYFGVFFSIYFPSSLYEGNILVYAHTLTCIHAFGIGGILSYFLFFNFNLIKLFRLYSVLASVALVLYLIIKIYFSSFIGLDRVLISLISSWSIFFLITKNHWVIDLFFCNPILLEIGRLSYGIYVFHNFIPVFLKAFFIYLNYEFDFDFRPDFNSSLDSILFYLTCFILLYIISSFSYYKFESRFLRLKKII